MNKRAIELSVNFLVMLILALVVFAGGLTVVKKFFGAAEQKREELDSETEQEIERLLMDGSKVGIPISKKEIRMGEDEIFGLGIYNVKGAPKDFTVTVTFSTGIDENNQEFPGITASSTYINENWIFGAFSSSGKVYRIENNRYEAVPILIKAYPNIGTNKFTEKGTYIFDVKVEVDIDNDGSPDELYDGYIHKIYVQVT